MLGIGWTEMLVVGVVALIVIGPKELPALMQKLGRFASTIRRMGNDFQREINKTTGLDEVRNLRSSITQPLKATTDAIRKEFNTTNSSGQVQPSGALKPANAGAESVVEEIHAAAGMKPAQSPSEAMKDAVTKRVAGKSAAAGTAAAGAAAAAGAKPSAAASRPARKAPVKAAPPKAKAAPTAPVKSADLEPVPAPKPADAPAAGASEKAPAAAKPAATRKAAPKAATKAAAKAPAAAGKPAAKPAPDKTSASNVSEDKSAGRKAPAGKGAAAKPARKPAAGKA